MSYSEGAAAELLEAACFLEHDPIIQNVAAYIILKSKRCVYSLQDVLSARTSV
jgi:hypothetical protein